jgi:hypothetical protein
VAAAVFGVAVIDGAEATAEATAGATATAATADRALVAAAADGTAAGASLFFDGEVTGTSTRSLLGATKAADGVTTTAPVPPSEPVGGVALSLRW